MSLETKKQRKIKGEPDISIGIPVSHPYPGPLGTKGRKPKPELSHQDQFDQASEPAIDALFSETETAIFEDSGPVISDAGIGELSDPHLFSEMDQARIPGLERICANLCKIRDQVKALNDQDKELSAEGILVLRENGISHYEKDGVNLNIKTSDKLKASIDKSPDAPKPKPPKVPKE